MLINVTVTIIKGFKGVPPCQLQDVIRVGWLTIVTEGPSMKDQHDTQTADLLPTKRPRGRPRTGVALSGAERQARHRAKLADNTVTVTFIRDDLPALKLLLANPNPALQVDQDTLDRLAVTLFAAAI